jgi:hypothetical protein
LPLQETERANEPVGDSLCPFLTSVRTPRVAILVPLEVLVRGGGSEMQDHYDSYGIRETEVAIEEFVNRLVELYPELDPLRASELIYEQVQNIVTAADRGEQY